MRLLPTEEMKKLLEEIRPYYDFSREDGLKEDTPDDIRAKDKQLKKLHDEQWEHAISVM